MKRVALIIVVLLQIAVLAYMAGNREWIVRTGATVLLRTAPVDPRDPMRGDYVALDYEIARVPRALLRGTLAATNRVPRHTPVYAVLATNAAVAELAYLTSQRPASGVYLRGTVSDSWYDGVTVRYGIEAYFMQQGAALALEQGRVQDGMQVPLEMEVAVGARGVPVIKRHHWAPLGIGVNVVPDPAQTNRHSTRRFTAVMLRIVNASATDVALVDLPGGRSFALRPASMWRENEYRWVYEDELPPAPQPSDVVVLAPGQVHTNTIMFSDPYWFVSDTKERREAKPLNDPDLTWRMYRLEYRAPDAAACAALPRRALIWQGRLATRAFSAGGAVD